MTKNTKKPWQGRFKGQTNKFVEEFTSSINVDYRLAGYNVWDLTHSRMLHSIGILTDAELEDLVALKKFQKNKAQL